MVEVEVSVAVAPDGRPMVLLQLRDGYLLVTGRDARHLARMLVAAAEELAGVGIGDGIELM